MDNGAIPANLNSVEQPKNVNYDDYDYGDFDFSEFDNIWKDLDDIDLNEFNEKDKALIKELLKNKNDLKKQLKHLFYLKSDDYYHKNKENLYNKYTLKDGSFLGLNGIIDGFKRIDNSRLARNEAWKQWQDYNNAYDNLAGKYNEYKTNVKNHVTNLRAEYNKHTRELDALKRIGLVNPYYYLSKNGNLSSSLNGFGSSGSLSLKSTTKPNNLGNIDELLKLLLSVISAAK